MLGHLPLVAMRMNRVKPAGIVEVETGPVPAWWHEGWFERGLSPSLIITQPEDPAAVDLRCAVGCLVHVAGDDERRVRAAYSSAVRGGASQVIASVYERNSDFNIVKQWDTTGVWQWQA